MAPQLTLTNGSRARSEQACRCSRQPLFPHPWGHAPKQVQFAPGDLFDLAENLPESTTHAEQMRAFAGRGRENFFLSAERSAHTLTQRPGDAEKQLRILRSEASDLFEQNAIWKMDSPCANNGTRR